MRARAAREERHGPVFIRAPPGRVEFLNSSQTVVPCDVQGVPRPEVWWWRVGSQGPAPDIPGLRHVRVQDGALVFSPFRAEDFRQDIHAAVYRCGARNSVGSIVSGDVHVRAGGDKPNAARRPVWQVPHGLQRTGYIVAASRGFVGDGSIGVATGDIVNGLGSTWPALQHFSRYCATKRCRLSGVVMGERLGDEGEPC
ncbi:hypothetical protein HPB50_018632 [Hyalomma asiaticum]|uniref:Uncharacterized protein n=1 Tax=Hyalomma asiaticum TaxID=266040 RepID=A0ACB7SMT4_HYAAI|nr:hypothetical protein HPB50_018632 [Hyalomma asiaticum]